MNERNMYCQKRVQRLLKFKACFQSHCLEIIVMKCTPMGQLNLEILFCSQKGKLISIIRQLNLRSKALYIRGLGREAQWNILQCFNFSKLFTFSILSRLKYHPRITFKNTLVFPLFQNLLSFDIFHSNLS